MVWICGPQMDSMVKKIEESGNCSIRWRPQFADSAVRFGLEGGDVALYRELAVLDKNSVVGLCMGLQYYRQKGVLS